MSHIEEMIRELCPNGGSHYNFTQCLCVIL